MKGVTAGKVRSVVKVAVVGLGYVGLPLALLFVKKGYTVYGLDVDAKKLESLTKEKSYLPDISDKELAEACRSGRFFPTDAFERITIADAIIICVPTPITTYSTPDLSYLQSAAIKIGKYLRAGHLVILESSTYPGTTNEVLKPELEIQSGLTAGKDFHIGYSPERIDPGNKQFDLETIPKIVSGLTKACATATYELYSRVFDRVVPVSTTEVAEMTKLLENTQRMVNISFINEIAVICDEMNIDIWEVIEAAKTKPFGFTPYYPGPGVGGHCIPVDPLYLQWKAKEYGKISRFIELSANINRWIPEYIANRVELLLTKHSNKTNPSVLVYGVAYKKDVNDVRESPAIELISLFKHQGKRVFFHDPLISEISVEGERMHSVELTDDLVKASDCVVIYTDHSSIPVDRIIALAPLVFDTRNVTAGRREHNHVFRLGAGF
ncbi:nucleotide sugar dehydrogenase [Paenibacillus thermotolerans]|uniref:nucleotide sugar dehydrogenase n=1 Tax=Paenibacillus thermotolerans TaxID=3027807 RepID=UPI002368A9C4|nr:MULTISPECIES: nucleotide sugar dehydrogenase [unclassified Paenibacillus]